MPGAVQLLLKVGVAAGFGAGLYLLLPALPAPLPTPVRVEPGPAPDPCPPCECPSPSARAREPDRPREPPEEAPAGGPDRQPEPARIDLNRASSAQLQSLPGIGPAKAERIIAARKLRPFARPEDLVRVKGIGPKTVRRLLPLIAVP